MCDDARRRVGLGALAETQPHAVALPSARDEMEGHVGVRAVAPLDDGEVALDAVDGAGEHEAEPEAEPHATPSAGRKARASAMWACPTRDTPSRSASVRATLRMRAAARPVR